MTDPSWTIGTSSGDITVDGLEGSMPSYRRGGSQSLTFIFRERSSGPSAIDRYESLREFQDFAHAVATFTSIEGEPFYREQHANDDELLMSFEPSGDLQSQGFSGFWAVVTNIGDETTIPGADASLSVEVFFLAELGDYPDRPAVKTSKEL